MKEYFKKQSLSYFQTPLKKQMGKGSYRYKLLKENFKNALQLYR
jgi:hypothetical protein